MTTYSDPGIKSIGDGLPRVKAGDTKLTIEQIAAATKYLCRHHAEDLAVVLGIATPEEQAASEARELATRDTR